MILPSLRAKRSVSGTGVDPLVGCVCLSVGRLGSAQIQVRDYGLRAPCETKTMLPALCVVFLVLVVGAWASVDLVVGSLRLCRGLWPCWSSCRAVVAVAREFSSFRRFAVGAPLEALAVLLRAAASTATLSWFRVCRCRPAA